MCDASDHGVVKMTQCAAIVGKSRFVTAPFSCFENLLFSCHRFIFDVTENDRALVFYEVLE